MNDVCQLLKETRLGKGLSLEEVAQRTYIKLHYLEALEEAQLDKLPAMVHTYGYIRQYAKLLGLDGGSLVAQFQQQERSTIPAKATRTPSAELFGDRMSFLKPIKATYGNGNGHANGHGHGHGNGNGAALVQEAEVELTPEVPSLPPVEPERFAAPSVLDGAAAEDRREAAPPAPRTYPEVAAWSTPGAPAVTPGAPAATPAFLRAPAEPADVAEARAQAQQLLLAAEREARQLVRGAEGYADEVLSQLEAEVGAVLQIVQNGRQFLAARRRTGPQGQA